MSLELEMTKHPETILPSEGALIPLSQQSSDEETEA
jgi:hypothetical protein